MARNAKPFTKTRHTALKHAKPADTFRWLSVLKYHDEQ